MSAVFADDGWRRFAPGQTYRKSGLDFRVRPGRKRARRGQDLVLEWLTPRGWVPIGFDGPGLIVDFLAENEGMLYPEALGFAGGKKVEQYLKRAIQHGHVAAERHLDAEKRAKRDQLFPEEDDQ